jgi:hypothetical protein
MFLLFRLFLTGRLDAGPVPDVLEHELPRRAERARAHSLGTIAVAALAIGVGATVLVDPGWGRVVGVPCLFVGAIAIFGLAAAGLGEES